MGQVCSIHCGDTLHYLAAVDLANTIRRASVDLAPGRLRIGQVLRNSPRQRDREHEHPSNRNPDIREPYTVVKRVKALPTNSGLPDRQQELRSPSALASHASLPIPPPIPLDHGLRALHARQTCAPSGRRLNIHGQDMAEKHPLKRTKKRAGSAQAVQYYAGSRISTNNYLTYALTPHVPEKQRSRPRVASLLETLETS